MCARIRVGAVRVFPTLSFLLLLSFKFSYLIVYFNPSTLSAAALNQIIFIPLHLPNQPGVHRLNEGSLTNTAKLAAGILFSPQFLYRMTGKFFSQAF